MFVAAFVVTAGAELSVYGMSVEYVTEPEPLYVPSLLFEVSSNKVSLYW